MLVTFRVKKIVLFCVKTLLHFALRSCYILRQKLLHFGLMLHFASKVVSFRVNVTFCVNCSILQRNTLALSNKKLPSKNRIALKGFAVGADYKCTEESSSEKVRLFYC